MILPEIIEKYRTELETTLKTSNEITFSLEETKPWESKLGGCPYLESLEDFPTKGILQFYIEDIEVYGYDELCKVRYIENYIKDEEKLIKENPFRENYVEMEPFERPGKISFIQRQMPISASLSKFDKNIAQKATDEEREALYDVCYASGSRVGGYP